jgi:ABC-type molybdenum transport system ATPase subunit/photorepair protein PhrA
MLLELNQITVPPGHRVLLSNVSWQVINDADSLPKT